MPAVLFRNRKYQTYFELLDSFRLRGCPLCGLLETNEREMVAGFVDSVRQRNKKAALLLRLCPAHRVGAKEILSSRPGAIEPLKELLSEKINEVANRIASSRSRWRRSPRVSRSGDCPLCQDLQSRERTCCRLLIRFLDEMDFWKAFQQASPLCSDHLAKCTAMECDESELSRLVEAQVTKLNSLLNELIRFEATGTIQESFSRALDWLADSRATALDASPSRSHPRQDEVASGSAAMEPAESETLDSEALSFENEKLKRKVDNLTALLGKAETRAASLHYRVAELSETNKILEMNLTGADALAKGLEMTVHRLKEQIKLLKSEAAANSAKRMS
jgi:hypothetical protein